MKHNITFLLVIILCISPIATTQRVDGQTSVNNFSLLIGVPAGHRILESYAFFIKQAVAPLGIDIQILAKPAFQFYSDIVEGRYDIYLFDAELSRLSNFNQIHTRYPSFNQFMSANGSVFFPTSNRTTSLTNGLSRAEVNTHISQIQNESDLIQKQSLIYQFTKTYMDQILYDVPLGKIQYNELIQKGFGLYNPDAICTQCPDDMWVVGEGPLNSRKFGAAWNNSTDNGRTSNETTFNYPMAPNGIFWNYYHQHISDPVLSFPYNKYENKAVDLLTSTLLSTDSHFNLHPEIAYNYLEENVNSSNGPLTKYTFFLDRAWNFSPTTDYRGNLVPTKPVDANDFIFTLKLLNNITKLEYFMPHLLNMAEIVDFNATTTIFTNDTLNIYSNSSVDILDNLADLAPYPTHIINETLLNSYGGKGFFYSNAWQHWQTVEGFTSVGAYNLISYILQDSSHPFTLSVKARSDYPFPNEIRTREYYKNNSILFDASYPDFNMSYFGPLTQNETEPYYWTFADNPLTASFEFPNTQGIEHVNFFATSNTEQASMFDAGQLDWFTDISGSNASLSRDYLSKASLPQAGYTSMIYNLNNGHLVDRNVRKAMALVLDKSEMKKITSNVGNFYSVDAPFSPSYDRYTPSEFKRDGKPDLTWYTSDFAIPYNYTTARDLMRASGYEALDSNTPQASSISSYSPVSSTTTSSSASLLDLGQFIFLIPFVCLVIFRRHLDSYHV